MRTPFQNSVGPNGNAHASFAETIIRPNAQQTEGIDRDYVWSVASHNEGLPDLTGSLPAMLRGPATISDQRFSILMQPWRFIP